MRVRVAVGAVLGAGLVFAAGQASGQSLSADEIVRRVMQHDAARHEALVRYGSERTYLMDYIGPIGERHARMQERMDYSAPEKKRFTVLSESGSTVFCHQIISRLMEGERDGALEANRTRSMLSPENYKLELEGEDTIAGVHAWVLNVTPKDGNKYSYKGRVWVSETEFAVMRIVGSPAKNPSWLMGSSTFDCTYAKDGEFWLPARNRTVNHLRIGGEVTLNVDYGRYEVVSKGPPDGVISASNRGAGGRGEASATPAYFPQ